MHAMVVGVAAHRYSIPPLAFEQPRGVSQAALSAKILLKKQG